MSRSFHLVILMYRKVKFTRNSQPTHNFRITLGVLTIERHSNGRTQSHIKSFRLKKTKTKKKENSRHKQVHKFNSRNYYYYVNSWWKKKMKWKKNIILKKEEENSIKFEMKNSKHYLNKMTYCIWFLSWNQSTGYFSHVPHCSRYMCTCFFWKILGRSGARF